MKILLIASLLVNVLRVTTLDIGLNLKLNEFYEGPQNIGVGLSHSSVRGNWALFLERLGVNTVRLFVDAGPSLRKIIDAEKWGQNLRGEKVTNQEQFIESIQDLRSKNGRNTSFDWINPVKWNTIFTAINRETRPIYGNSENTLKVLKSMKIDIVLVQHIGCTKSLTSFEFFSMNRSTPEYWSERWELYKHSYALAVWAQSKGIRMIEFYNEPDLDLSECLDVDKFKDYYFIRSLSIQDSYQDTAPNNSAVNILASAFGRKTYGGDVSRYLGDICVLNNNFKFDQNKNVSNWSNMHMYSFHSYGKTGADLKSDFEYIQASVDSDNRLNSPRIPVIITEHNSRSSSNWNEVSSTADDPYEASKLASQMINLIKARIHTHIIFKFAISASFSASRDIAKNGLHWAEFYDEPFHISDTTLSAEFVRLLSKMKQSKIYTIQSNDTSKFRTYVASADPSRENGYIYIYAVNDKNESINLFIDISELKINENSEIIVEEASSNYLAEIVDLIKINKTKAIVPLTLNPFSIIRLAIQLNKQNKVVSNLEASCTVYLLSRNESKCSDLTLKASTSNTRSHENTSVIILDYDLDVKRKNQKTLLTLVSTDLGSTTNDINLQVLGVPFTDNASEFAFLKSLPSDLIIDSISKNFIEWNISQISMVGHISVKKNENNKIHMIDITDYINKLSYDNSSKIRLVLYRPYRHNEYQTSAGIIKEDDLSNGSVACFHSLNSKYPPQLIHYWHQPDHVDHLNRSVVESLFYPNSKLVELSNLSISSIDLNTFFQLNTLEHLYLNSNKLKSINSKIFEGLTMLKQLYLKNNLLNYIDSLSFNSLVSLNVLRLDGNKLNSLDLNVFKGLNRLEYLYLSNNELTRIKSGLFADLISLKYLNVENNNIVAIDKSVFSGNVNLELVCLYENPVSVFVSDSLEQNLCNKVSKCKIKTDVKCDFIKY